MKIKLSLIVPIYNAESFILNTLLQLSEWKRKIDYSVEILLIDDGSTDETKHIVENYINYKDRSINMLSFKSNQGKGYAIKRGMLASKGKFKIFTDADIPYGTNEFDKILYYLDFKEYDICVGNRKSKESNYHINLGLMRKISSKIFTFFISRYVVTGMRDTQCGLKGFTSETAEILFSKLVIKGFAFDVELLYLAYKYDMDIKRIPVLFQGNNISTINLFYSSMQMLKDVLILPYNYHILKKY
ncbi:glycosyltransferase [Seonamhaeicola maritimus]|uniref:glycosyltransferase n=1 Tax=Seonamhaeicola maritimus TaxID=2591822 RepID=UPI0024949CC0|nr:glycosyltransferase [Seonamhaeicola maritimus]